MARHCRKFTVLDALIMIAAIAIGLAWTRYFQNSEAGGESYPYIDGMAGPVSAFRHGIELANWWVVGLSYCMAVVTITLLVLRLRERPRKRLRYLTRLPGAVAGGAVSLTVLWDLSYAAIEVLIGITSGGPFDSIWEFTYLLQSGENAGVAVAVAWVLLATSGRWRREPGWLDGIGLALGIFWLLQVLLASFVRIVSRLPV
jgi:hypothetical protein